MNRFPESKHGPRRGFTQVELLVVIVIIAVLAAFAFPVLSGMRQRAKGAHSISNLRQVGTLLMAYPPDNNNCLPLLRTTGLASPPDTIFWQNVLRMHAGLPTGPDMKGTWLPDCFYDPLVKEGRQHLWGCFGGNSAILLDENNCRARFGHANGTPFTSIGLPSRKVVACSSSNVAGARFDSSWYFQGDKWVAQGSGSTLPRPDARNAGLTPSLFADGHVENLDTDGMDRSERARFFQPDP